MAAIGGTSGEGDIFSLTPSKGQIHQWLSSSQCRWPHPQWASSSLHHCYHPPLPLPCPDLPTCLPRKSAPLAVVLLPAGSLWAPPGVEAWHCVSASGNPLPIAVEVSCGNAGTIKDGIWPYIFLMIKLYSVSIWGWLRLQCMRADHPLLIVCAQQRDGHLNHSNTMISIFLVEGWVGELVGCSSHD